VPRKCLAPVWVELPHGLRRVLRPHSNPRLLTALRAGGRRGARGRRGVGWMRARAAALCLLLVRWAERLDAGGLAYVFGMTAALVHVGAGPDLNFATWAGRRRSLTGSIDLADSTIADWP